VTFVKLGEVSVRQRKITYVPSNQLEMKVPEKKKSNARSHTPS